MTLLGVLLAVWVLWPVPLALVLLMTSLVERWRGARAT
jgi:hypothetical protein